ncbi:MAG: hypothetical protein ACK4YF_08145 [Exilispira sp.]
MKTNFFLMLLIIFIIFLVSIFYLSILQKEKKIDNEIENQRKINHNLKVFLKSKLSIFNLSKILDTSETRPLNENDIIILQKAQSSEDSKENKDIKDDKNK